MPPINASVTNQQITASVAPPCQSGRMTPRKEGGE